MKKYIITGSIGHISKPIVQQLVKEGKDVSVITSTHDRVREIEKLGAKALAGSVLDGAFVEKAFNGADVVYTMIPPIWQTNDWRASQNIVGRNYSDAITRGGLQYVVNLSSIGAHIDGIGPADGLHDFEKMLNAISGLNIKHLRPSYFFNNLMAQIGLIKKAGFMGANYGDDGEKLLLVHTNDIAAAAVEELLNLKFTGNSVRYIFGDERSGKEIAEVLGKAIGKDLKWVIFSDEQQKNGLLQAGVSEVHATAYTQMGKAMREGRIQAHARMNKPALSHTKLEDFAVEFAAAFRKV